MLTRRRFLTLTGVSGIAVAGLALGYRVLPSDSEGKGDGPPSIAIGSDTCAHCNMVISDIRFAAAWRDADGRPERFDDIGCMVAMFHDANPGAATQFWVHSYSDESLLEAGTATYVLSEAIITPMSYGIAAVSGQGEADILLKEAGGEAKTWAAVLAKPSEHGGH